MLKITANHYIETIIFSIDKIIKCLKTELKQKVDSLNIGITGEQFVVLDTISAYPGIYQQKLSEILMKDKSNTTRILGVLEKEGLIYKTIGKVGQRLVNFLNVTEKGKKIVNENMPQIKKFIEAIFENITNDEISTLHTMSKKFQTDLFTNILL